jgi:hypothetical protein
MQKVVAPSVIIAASLMVEAEAIDPLSIFIGSYTEDMQGLTLGVNATNDGHPTNPLGEGIYSAELTYDDECWNKTWAPYCWTFSAGSHKLAHNSTNVDDVVNRTHHLGKNPSFVKVEEK